MDVVLAAYYHYYRKNQVKQFEESMQKYAKKWFAMLNAARSTYERDNITRDDAEIFLYTDPHKGSHKYLLQAIKKARNQGNYRRKRKKGQRIYDDIKFLTTRGNEKDRTNRLAKEGWSKAVTKLRIGLPWLLIHSSILSMFMGRLYTVNPFRTNISKK
eukprot:142975_1